MTLVRHFRQRLLWPLQLMPTSAQRRPRHSRPWEDLLDAAVAHPWRDAIEPAASGSGPRGWGERHYNEFVTFLPYVQRFLYGDGRSGGGAARTGGNSSVRVLCRDDVARVRLRLSAHAEPIELQLDAVELYFFYDVDVFMLHVELHGEDLPLATVQEVLYRFGRGYPPGWDQEGRGLHCAAEVEWLDAQGRVLSSSDTSDREAFLSFVARHRAPRLAAHWRWLLAPLVPDQEDVDGPLRYRQIEYHRMPVMGYLSVDDPTQLSRADFVRLGLVSGSGSHAEELLPFAEQHLADFEARYCYDRFWCRTGAAPHTRYLSCGHALVVIGSAQARFFTDGERGVLAQFRHQHFLLFLIAHFQKAALLLFSDRLVVALDGLDITNADSVKGFKRAIRHNFETFLRFTHRYWFHDISEQVQTRALYRLCVDHLGLDTLYPEVRERISEMNTYLDTDSIRRQANTVVRLTVVTIAGLIGTLSTGFLGMNIFNEADAPWPQRLLWLMLTLVASLGLTVFTILKSKRLSDGLDLLSDDRMGLRDKWQAWRRPEGTSL